nr:MAG TPA: hypothetical protein [Caudoviricetes sp.]
MSETSRLKRKFSRQQIWQGQGYKVWSVYTNNKYLRYL